MMIRVMIMKIMIFMIFVIRAITAEKRQGSESFILVFRGGSDGLQALVRLEEVLQP